MSKLVLNILFSSFLLFQTAAVAEENTSMETPVEDQETQEINTTKETAQAEQKESEAAEPEETLSEAQKEALEAEEAELREAGIYDEERIEE
ncbi:MAG TPA: hypothetical protein VLL31_01025 [Sulfurovum sp.]|nr:hypothetical protein [Sulfurovum sp.]